MHIKLIAVYLVSIISCLSLHHLRANAHELPLVISVCSYNNAPWVEMNLNSIFMQDYDNFRVVYIDDASTDDTVSQVQAYIDAHQLHKKITIQANPSRCRKTKNIYNFFHTCQDQEIIVQVDGDDWLVHDQVFTRINQTYQHHDVWLTYGHYVAYPSGDKGCCKPVPHSVIEKRSFRSWKWVYTHLRTFKAWLFKNIKLEDFISEKVPGFKGKFFPLNDDRLSYMPMLEMCGDKFFFIPEILYTHNKGNPLYSWTVDSNLYTPSRRDIKKRAKYPQVAEPILDRLAPYEHAQADLIVLSKDNPIALTDALSSYLENLSGLKDIYVIYESDENSISQYLKVQTKYPEIQFIPMGNTTLAEVLLDIVHTSNQDHMVITQDTFKLKDSCDVHACIVELERTFAYGFYLGFAPNQAPFISSKPKKKPTPCQHVHEDIYTWKFCCGPKGLCNNLDMTLIRKNTLQERLALLPLATTINGFKHDWQNSKHASGHNVGLFFETTKLRHTS